LALKILGRGFVSLLPLGAAVLNVGLIRRALAIASRTIVTTLHVAAITRSAVIVVDSRADTHAHACSSSNTAAVDPARIRPAILEGLAPLAIVAHFAALAFD
jgi:hypothetical protein